MIKRCPDCRIQTLAHYKRALGEWFCIWCGCHVRVDRPPRPGAARNAGVRRRLTRAAPARRTKSNEHRNLD